MQSYNTEEGMGKRQTFVEKNVTWLAKQSSGDTGKYNQSENIA